ncbi:hypothetical protein L226DRAFT_607426 [Lentinus tigrinus ALCF2SS1-7]|uniref:uncharacterized protein n=1 Tax=Lentinus tigrinus ALCF2SS1-7 TaxID=1328758 RepID=UPI001165EF2B|nr:hypothetical protein L226DRAFT_607426 [Lentinus tigrinus ALCF2SS1-7]
MSQMSGMSNCGVEDRELWFQDGNVVLVAQSRAFRVHRSILSRHSEIFSNLFAIPPPSSPDLTEQLDGLPVIPVSDSAHDFKHLLHALYDGSSYLKHGEPIPFAVLAALARLAHKYQLDELLAGACGRLASVFSADFDQWRITCGASNSLVSLEPTDAIEAFHLFRLIDRTDMIPTALYACCQLPFQDLLQGVMRADGTLEKLSSEDLERCLSVREFFTTAFAWMSLTFLDVDPDVRCNQPALCAESIQKLRLGPQSGPDICQGTKLLSNYFSTLAKSMKADGFICGECLGMLLRRQYNLLRKIWSDLPALMQLKDIEWSADT